MSITNEDGVKIVLERSGPEEFWKVIEQHYAEDDPFKWKYLAALVLRELACWPVDRIAMALDHDKGYISRALLQIQSELGQKFRTPPGWDPDDPQRSPEGVHRDS